MKQAIVTLGISWIIFISFHFFWVVVLGLPPLTDYKGFN